MTDFVEYLLHEVKRRAISQADALDILEQYSASRPAQEARLHPLVHRNSSTLAGQRFSTSLDGSELILRDHVVTGTPVVPAAAYLEMAHAVCVQSLEADVRSELTSVRMRNVVWSRPIFLKERQEIHISLNASEPDRIDFEVHTLAGAPAEQAQRFEHARGRIHLAKETQPAQRLDIEGLRGRLERTLPVSSLYDQFSAGGLQYGPGYRSLQSVGVGVDADGLPFVLAEVSLPECVMESSDSYYLNPSVLDGALQATAGLSVVGEQGTEVPPSRPFLPLALDTVEILERIPRHASVLVRRSPSSGGGATPGAGTLLKFDIDVADRTGRVCVRMRGLAARTFDEDKARVESSALLLRPSWQAKPLPHAESAADVAQWWVLLDPAFQSCLDALRSQHPATTWELLGEPPDPQPGMTQRLGIAAEQVFARIQSILREAPQRPVLLQTLVSAESPGLHGALGGLLKSASRENPRLRTQLIELSSSTSADDVARILIENAGQGLADADVRYVGGHREVAVLEELGKIPLRERFGPWKDGGVYLITGGAGGLGMIFAREIVTRTKNARIVLVGRRSLSADQRERLDTLVVNGAALEYRALDVADEKAMQECSSDIVARFGSLDGIVHAAGVIRDSLIVKKSVEDFRAVISPKVAGVVSLDSATRALRLDFFILFSSMAGAIGNVGQADYALANAFLDRFAAHRSDLVARGERHGRTLSINWPLWLEGGMSVDRATREQLHRHGIHELPTDEGVRALHAAWNSGESRIAVLSAKTAQAASQILGRREAKPPQAQSPAPVAVAKSTSGKELLRKVEQTLTTEICRQLKLNEADIDAETQLSELGFDSITLTGLATTLQETYGLEISPTVFFEHTTVREFARYLLNEHGQRMAELFAQPQALSASSAPRGPSAATASSAPSGPSAPSAPQAPSATAAVEASPEPTATISVRSNTTSRRMWARQTSAEPPREEYEPIAIVGMSGSFPGAPDLDTFWENLAVGRDCITEIPESRWDWKAIYGDARTQVNKTPAKWGAFMDGLEEFDPLFFGISPKEARCMDPQQRLLLTHAWKTIEDAGYPASALSGSSTGVFFATGSSGYGQLLTESNVPIEGYSALGIVPSVGPNRLSYFLDLHGPSEPIETACSSSLVAIHRAVRAIHAGDCEMALVGGVNVILVPWPQISFSRAGMLAEDGRCKSFAADANGYVRGEGIGVILLKTLRAAQRDGDNIHAVIRGSAENHGGRASSLTAPNPQAQAALIKAAHRVSAIDPRTITYIEAHGTGTPLGDPLEIRALRSAFADSYASSAADVTVGAEQHCGIGSVKSNIGHLEMAAGIAGVMKVLLQMRHRTLVPSLHCERVNPLVELAGSPFYIVRESRPWRALSDRSGRELPRRAGVSSFGFGGVNAHVVLEEYLAPEPARGPSRAPSSAVPALVVLSAKSPERLKAHVAQLLGYVQSGGSLDTDLHDIAYTLQVGREAMGYRVGFLATTVTELTAQLQAFVRDEAQIRDCYRGDVQQGKATLASLATDAEEGQELLELWSTKGRYGKVLELWSKGVAFDWRALYRKGGSHAQLTPRRVRLPTYPFARTRFWLACAETSPAEATAARLDSVAGLDSVASTDSAPGLDSVASLDSAPGLNSAPGLDSAAGLDSVADLDAVASLVSAHGPDSAPAVQLSATPEDLSEHDASPVSASPPLAMPVGASAEMPDPKVGHFEQMLREGIAETLGLPMDQIDPGVEFSMLGMDSISGVACVQWLYERHAITIEVANLADYPNVRALATYLSEQNFAQPDGPSANDSAVATDASTQMATA